MNHKFFSFKTISSSLAGALLSLLGFASCSSGGTSAPQPVMYGPPPSDSFEEVYPVPDSAKDIDIDSGRIISPVDKGSVKPVTCKN